MPRRWTGPGSSSRCNQHAYARADKSHLSLKHYFTRLSGCVLQQLPRQQCIAGSTCPGQAAHVVVRQHTTSACTAGGGSHAHTCYLSDVYCRPSSAQHLPWELMRLYFKRRSLQMWAVCSHMHSVVPHAGAIGAVKRQCCGAALQYKCCCCRS